MTTVKEATKEARQRWGIYGDAWLHYAPGRGMICRVGIWKDLPMYMGEGSTWSEAFEAATKREAEQAHNSQ